MVSIKGSREAGKEAVSGLVREDKDPHRAVRQGGVEEMQGQSKRTGGWLDRAARTGVRPWRLPGVAECGSR